MRKQKFVKILKNSIPKDNRLNDDVDVLVDITELIGKKFEVIKEFKNGDIEIFEEDDIMTIFNGEYEFVE